MTYTRAIGLGANKIIRLIVRLLALSKINPNVLTFLGLVINIIAAGTLAYGHFRTAGLIIIFAGLFDMVDGRVARETNGGAQPLEALAGLVNRRTHLAPGRALELVVCTVDLAARDAPDAVRDGLVAPQRVRPLGAGPEDGRGSTDGHRAKARR